MKIKVKIYGVYNLSTKSILFEILSISKWIIKFQIKVTRNNIVQYPILLNISCNSLYI